MKKCTQCKSVVDALSECPVCGQNITNVENQEQLGESYVLNKYFLLYLIKKQWFLVICLIISVVKLCFSFGQISLISIILAVLFFTIAFAKSLFKNRIDKIFSFKYSEDYLEFMHNIIVYSSAFLGVFSAFFGSYMF